MLLLSQKMSVCALRIYITVFIIFAKLMILLENSFKTFLFTGYWGEGIVGGWIVEGVISGRTDSGGRQ